MMSFDRRLGRWWVWVFCSLSVACSSNGGGGDSNACGNDSVSGYRSFTENGVTREYILQLPSGYDPASSTPLPLIINFHGNGGWVLLARRLMTVRHDLTALANSHNVIIAYPQGVVRVKGAAEWDPGGGGGSDLNNNDVYFSQQLIAHISAGHTIDATPSTPRATQTEG